MVSTSGPWATEIIEKNLGKGSELCAIGAPPVCEFPFHAGTAKERFRAFLSAQEKQKILWAIKGGYGASDLLPLLAHSRLQTGRVLVGCSDVTALFPLLIKLGWKCLHAHMPGFRKFSSDSPAGQALRRLFSADVEQWKGQIDAAPTRENIPEISGKLFCGNLAVLSSLIGTPYFEPFQEPTILVLEDISENPGRIIRAWSQWQQAGMLENVAAVVLGRFTDMPGDSEQQELLVQSELQRRNPSMPFFITKSVGHIDDNYPLLLGAETTLKHGQLFWQAT